MKAKNTTEVRLKISTKEICYQYCYENENYYWDKGKKKKDSPPQARMIQHTLSLVPRLRKPGIKDLPGKRKNMHGSEARGLWEIPNDTVACAMGCVMSTK